MGYDLSFDQNNPLKPITARYYMEAASAPSVAEDVTSNFGVGCIWVDTSTIPRDVYMCVDNAEGAAVWTRVNVRKITSPLLPLDADGVFHIPLVNAGRIIKLTSAVSGTTTANGAATIQAGIGTAGSFTNVTDGLLTIASGAVIGETDEAIPSAANAQADDDDVLELTVTDGTQDAAATAIVTVDYVEQSV